MNTVDLALGFILFLFALRGYFRGFFRESFSLLGLVLGFVVAIRYDDPIAALWKGYWKVSPVILKAVTFVVLFFVVYFVLNLVGLLLHHSAKFLFLQTLNRLGGIALAVGKGAVLLALALLFISSSSWMPQQLREGMDKSHLVAPLRHFGRKLVDVAKADLLQPAELRERRRQSAEVL